MYNLKCVYLLKHEVFDIETKEEGGKLKPVLFIYTDNGKTFIKEVNNSDDCVQIIMSSFKTNVIYFAHNLMFDFFILLRAFIKLRIKIEWVFIEKKLYGVNLNYTNKLLGGHKNNSIILRCSLKFFPMPLANLYPKLSDIKKLPFPYNDLISSKLNNKLKDCNIKKLKIDPCYLNWTLFDYLKLYAKVDVEILLNVLIKFYKFLSKLNINMNHYCYSISYISILYFKKFHKLNVLKLAQRDSDLIRRGYFGGRCEVFGNKKSLERVFYFDFRGMYTSVMQESIPYGNYKYEQDPETIDLPGFYSISCNVKSFLPILPLKKNKLVFPEGAVSGIFWHEEIKCALDLNEVSDLKIYYRLVPHNYDQLLKDFSQSLDKMRSESNFNEVICKIIANALYGRLGMSDNYKSEYLDLQKLIKFHSNIKNSAEFEELNLNEFIVQKTNKRKILYANVGIAASITSKARIKLARAMHEVIETGGRLLYCDTDSIFAAYDSNDFEIRLPVNDIILKNKLKYGNLIDAIFIAPKTYGLKFQKHDLIKIKGITDKNISFYQLKNNFLNSERINFQQKIIYTQLNNIKISSSFREIRTDYYDKRTWSHDKITTKPLKV